jgi:homoserine kinase type II
VQTDEKLILAAACRHWEIPLTKIRSDVDLAGSPDRTTTRYAVADRAGQGYVLEQIAPDRRERKVQIARTIDALSRNGFALVDPYLTAADGHFVVEIEGYGYWQLRPFHEGIPLPRPAYIYDRWRGQAAAQTLRALRVAADGLEKQVSVTSFSITDYISEFLDRLNRHKPDFAPELDSIMAFLNDRFMPAHDDLPTAFCHGDFHPLNVVWGQEAIERLIDWEFCGQKPELYDAALMAGCLGMENPEGLTGGAFKTFIASLRDSNFAQSFSWDLFRELTVAIRLAWLKEWFRHDNWKMIELEVVFMRLLINDTRLNRLF